MRFITVLAALLLAGIPTTSAFAQEPIVVERVVAVVAGTPILLSQLASRARPLLSRVANDAHADTNNRKIYQALLTNVIEERLIAKHAAELAIGVSKADVERALNGVAKQNRLTLEQLLESVKTSAAMTPAAYRGELARQILQQKVVQRLVMGKMPRDARAQVDVIAKARAELLKGLRKKHSVEVHVRFQ